MQAEEIFNTLVDIIQNKMSIKNVEIKMETALIGESVFDSMDVINYLTHIEEDLNINISDEDFSEYKLGIMNNMVNYLKDKVG